MQFIQIIKDSIAEMAEKYPDVQFTLHIAMHGGDCGFYATREFITVDSMDVGYSVRVRGEHRKFIHNLDVTDSEGGYFRDIPTTQQIMELADAVAIGVEKNLEALRIALA